MVNLNNLFTKKEKSKDDLMRERLSRDSGNSGLLVGAIWCGIALVWALLFVLIGDTASSKIIGGIISVPLLALCVYNSAFVFLVINISVLKLTNPEYDLFFG